MTRLRPSRSLVAPANGATRVTASSGRVIASEVCAAVMWNASATSGRMACGV